MKDVERKTRLECLKIAAEARAKIGFYKVDGVLADAEVFYSWAEGQASKSEPSESGKVKPDTG